MIKSLTGVEAKLLVLGAFSWRTSWKFKMAAIMFIQNGIIDFLVPTNVCLDTKIESLGGL